MRAMSTSTSCSLRLACGARPLSGSWQAVRRFCRSPTVIFRHKQNTCVSLGHARLYRTSAVYLSKTNSSVFDRTLLAREQRRKSATPDYMGDHPTDSASSHSSSKASHADNVNHIRSQEENYLVGTSGTKGDFPHPHEPALSSQLDGDSVAPSRLVSHEQLSPHSVREEKYGEETTGDADDMLWRHTSRQSDAAANDTVDDTRPASDTLRVSDHMSFQEGAVNDQQTLADASSSSRTTQSTQTEAAVGDNNYTTSRESADGSALRDGNGKSSSRSRSPSPQESILRKLFASWQQGVVASIGAFMGVGFLVFLFYAPVKEDTVHHTAVVASEALADTRLRAQAIELSKGVVTNILNDDASQAIVVKFVQKLLAQEDTRIAVSSLLRTLFEDHYTQEVTKKFVLTIVRDTWVREQLHLIAKEQALRILSDEKVKQALSNLLITSAADALQEPELRYEAVRAIRSSIGSIFRFF